MGDFSPVVVLYDENGNPVVVSPDAVLPVGTKVLVFAGKESDGTLRIPSVVQGGDGKNRIQYEGKATLYDESGNPVAVSDDTAVVATTKAILMAGKSSDGMFYVPTVELDDDGRRKLQIQGEVSVVTPAPPAGATQITIAADDPLDMDGTEITSYVITSGTTFHMQQLAAGSEGDPTEKGSKIEVYYWDGTDEHLVERVYITGFTQSGIYPDTSESRDGTSMVGDGTNEIRVKRIRMSGTKQEIDAVVRGYEQ